MLPVVDVPVQPRHKVILVSPRVIPVVRSHADAPAVLEYRLGRGVEVDVRVRGGVSPQLLTGDGQGRGGAGVHHHRAGHGAGQDGAPGHGSLRSHNHTLRCHLEILVRCKVRGAPCISSLHPVRPSKIIFLPF